MSRELGGGYCCSFWLVVEDGLDVVGDGIDVAVCQGRVGLAFASGEVVAWGDAPGFPGYGAGCVGADFAGVGPGVDSEQTWGDGCGDVHWSAIDADGVGGVAEEVDESGEGGFVGGVDGVWREVGDG